MISLTEFKKILEQSNATKEQKEKVMESVTPLFDLNEYLKKKLSLSDEGVDAVMKIYFQENQKTFLEQLSKHCDAAEDVEDDKLKEATLISLAYAPIMRSFCEKHDYHKIDEVVESFTNFFAMFCHQVAK